MDARNSGTAPEILKPDTLYFMLDAGRKRRADFLKHFPGGSRAKTTMIRDYTLHITEATYRRRCGSVLAPAGFETIRYGWNDGSRLDGP